MTQICVICGTPAGLKCGGCKNVVYCGKDHQKIDWKNGHKKQCRCFEIASNISIGRHCRATRDIKQNEIILREHPILQGPKIVSRAMCLGCNRHLDPMPYAGKNRRTETNFYKCSKCKWPMCNINCEKSNLHVDECDLISKKNFQCPINYIPTEKDKRESAYCTIVPLRCLLLNNRNPSAYQQFMNLEDHLNERINTPIYNILKANLVTFIREVLGLTQYDERTILKIAAILDTNCFEIRPYNQQSKIRALFPQASMFSHHCVPNTRHVFTETNEMLMIATVDIPKGSIINVTYTQVLKSTLERREHLKQAKCFDCICTRCSDPFELETYFGAINCSRCKTGKIISTNPLDSSAAWQCQACNHEIGIKQIKWGNNTLQKEIENLNKKNPKEFEEFLIKYEEALHPLNNHVIQIKYALTQLYGNIHGFYLHELTDAAIQRKIDLCNELLRIAEIFDPGASRFRGLLLLDLQDCLTVQTKREFLKDLLTKQGAQEKLIESMNLLQEAVSILQIEPGMSNTLEERVRILALEIDT